MGVTIHYGGKLKSIDLIEDLVDEMIEVSNVNDWNYHIINTSNSTNHNDSLLDLKGISFGPDESECIWFTFTQSGELISPMVAMFHQSVKEPTKKSDFQAFTKTQEAGPEFHIKVVNILKYVSKKYFSESYIQDESRYYETEDRDELEYCMGMIDKSLAALNEAFEVHGEGMAHKSEAEIKDFIAKVLGGQAIDIKVIKLGGAEEE